MVIPTDGNGPPLPPPNPCNTPACLNAKAEVTAARAAFVRTCNSLTTIVSILRVLKPIVTISLWYILVIIVVAIILFLLGLGWLAVLLWALILVYLIAWIAYLAFGRAAGSLAQELVERTKALQDAIAKVVLACPENCRGDLSIPTCDAVIP
jgi:ABC-type transport system involved in cytochrome bd biosynthesis fused ATPase/permease subunit